VKFSTGVLNFIYCSKACLHKPSHHFTVWLCTTGGWPQQHQNKWLTIRVLKVLRSRTPQTNGRKIRTTAWS